MKIKRIVLLAGIFSVAIFGTAFVSPQEVKEVKPIILEEEVGNLSFANFLSKFEKTTLPFNVGVDDLYKYKDLKEIKRGSFKKFSKKGSSDNMTAYLPELKGKAFSRMGPPKIMPVARFYLDNKRIAVVYKTSRSFFSEHDFGFNMMVYDLKGNILTKPKKKYETGSFNLAFNSIEETQTFSIDKEGTVWKKTYKNIWKDDILEDGYEGNEIVGYELTSTAAFQIKKNGSVVDAKEYLTDSRASLD